MKLQDQCCTRLQAEKLKELGISQEAFLFHYQDKTPLNPNLHYYGYQQEWMPWEIYIGGAPSRISTSNVYEEFAAFTVAELGQMAPNGYDTMRITGHTPHLYMWRGYDLGGKAFPSDRGYRTEAECRASMLIYLLENHLITAEDVNARLKG